MSDLSDLPLFSWRQVISFPVAKQAVKVRETAEELLDRDGERAVGYAKMISLGIRRRMTAQGFDDAAIEHQVATFWEAVHSEMVRITYGERQAPDGAA